MLGIAVGFAVSSTTDVGAQEQPTEATAGPRRHVYVGVYLHDVAKFDQKDGVFDADLEIWAKWLGTLDPEHIQIANAAETERTFLGAEDDRGWHSARWRVRGTLRGEFPLQSFPFDEQTLAVELELPEEDGTLVPDLASSGMAERFSLTDWLYTPEFEPAVETQVFPSDLGSLAREGRTTTVHRVSYRVHLARPILTVILKLFLPLAIILIVAMSTLFIAPDNIDARSAMAVTALLSCFAFQFTISDSLPAVAYITLADSLFILAYVLSTIIVIETIIAYILARRDRTRAAIWIDRVARLLLPAAATLVVWQALPAPTEAVAEPIEALPFMPRHASARDTLRIGTNMLRSVTGSPLAIAASFGLVHEDADLGDQVLYVERAPGVDNDAIRFLAGGEIVVTWRIREGAKWSDGTALTAQDMLFELEASPDPHVVDASAPDDRTVVLRWDDRLARALEAPGALPSHALRRIYEAPNVSGEGTGGYDAVKAYRDEHPIPTLGPYHITAYEAGARLVAEANPNFIGPAPNIARVELIGFEDQAASRHAFEVGEIDMIVPNGITVDDVVALRQSTPDAVHVQPAAVFVFLQPDRSDPRFARVEVRRAIMMALDRDRIVRESYAGGLASVAHTAVPEPLPEGLTPVPFDPVLAKAELERLGMAGQTVKLLHVSSPQNGPMMEIIVANLTEAGLVVELQEERSTLSAWRDGGHTGLVMHVMRSSRDSDPRRYWNVPLVDGNYDVRFRNDAYDDDVNALVEREMRALYEERRGQLREQLFVEWSRRLPAIPLLFASERVLVDAALHGWQTGPEIAFGSGMEKWWFDDAVRSTAPSAAPPTSPTAAPDADEAPAHAAE